jgi:hypothetical protein
MSDFANYSEHQALLSAIYMGFACSTELDTGVREETKEFRIVNVAWILSGHEFSLRNAFGLRLIYGNYPQLPWTDDSGWEPSGL